MSELKQAWEYSFIHSSATGRGDEEIGPCLTYEKAVAFGKGCIKQREVFVSTQPEATKPAQDLGAAILALEVGTSGSKGYAKAFHAGARCMREAAANLAALASPADALVAGDSAQSEDNADAKDAERYRFLRNPNIDVALVLDKQTDWIAPDDSVHGVGGYYVYEYRAGKELDDAIDAASVAQANKEQGNG